MLLAQQFPTVNQLPEALFALRLAVEEDWKTALKTNILLRYLTKP